MYSLALTFGKLITAELSDNCLLKLNNMSIRLLL